MYLFHCVHLIATEFDFGITTSSEGSCLLWVMSTETSVDIAADIAVDIAVDSRSIVGRQSVDTRSTVYRQSVDIAVDSQSTVGR